MSDTKDEILRISERLLAERGVGGLSFDEIARRLGKTKQAVLYWFPSKPALLTAMYLPWLAEEASAVEAALRDASNEREAVDSFVKAVTDYHFASLDRFRLMYLAPQLHRPAEPALPAEALAQIHRTTERLYSALAAHLGGEDSRARAMSLHAAALGQVMLIALGEALGDPMKHGPEKLATQLREALSSDD